ncbi:MAG: alpha/beta hydrolase [Alphaproteobacteria bacterium]|nr:alpha/beta hydrolase [Alphaproteobacteria bacterium]
MIHHVLRTAAGLHVDAVAHGPRSGDAIVFLHGYTDSRRAFAPMLAHMPPDRRCIAFSHRGHGDSDKPRTGYRIDDLVDDLAAVMERLEVPRAVLVGHSMGSLVATRYALTRPDRVAGLALIGGFAALRGNAVVEAFWRETIADLVDPVDPAMSRAFQESTLARPVPAAFLDTVVTESLKLPARVWTQTLRGLLDEDFSRSLARIAVPALLIRGDRDTFSDAAEQRRLQAFLPGAERITIDGAGHAPHWEDPRGVADLIAGFARSALHAMPPIGPASGRLALPELTTYVA